MDYMELTPDQQYQVVQQRIRQYEQSFASAVRDYGDAVAAASDTANLESQIGKWQRVIVGARKSLPEQRRHTAARQWATLCEQSHLLATVDLMAANAADEKPQADSFTAQLVKWKDAADAAHDVLAGMPKPESTTSPDTQRNLQPSRLGRQGRT